METRNLLSVHQGSVALETVGAGKEYKILKENEIKTLQLFCDEMKKYGCDTKDLDGYFVGYTIDQMGKEFDLLRFSKEDVIDIELKSPLSPEVKIEKIEKQMKQNFHYLKFLEKNIRIYTYVEEDGFYTFDHETSCVKKVSPNSVLNCIQQQTVDYDFSPDKEFKPSRYLVSPFNSTDKFMNDEYFLTSNQETVKKDIVDVIEKRQYNFCCISANAGTGKTLLLFDIVKEMMRKKQKVRLFHCGKLNEGHLRLQSEYKWDIHAIKEINNNTIDSCLDKCSVVFIDEAQRIRNYQLKLLVENAIEKGIIIVFSYDEKQFLQDGENKNIYEYLLKEYPNSEAFSKTLTTKVRTNKELASFIRNLFKIGSYNHYLNYQCVSVDYINDREDLRNYIEFLHMQGWTVITYTTSHYNRDTYDSLRAFSEKTAHDVIGQEFSKVAFIMDEHFRFTDEGTLQADKGYYSAQGMLYQIVTRVVNNLKVIVYNNPNLYSKLLELKSASWKKEN